MNKTLCEMEDTPQIISRAPHQFELGEQIINEILRFANKVPSPRSITASLPDDNAAVINKLAKDFLYRTIEMTLKIMEHFMYMTIHPIFVSHALEYFVNIEITSHDHLAHALQRSNLSPDNEPWSTNDELDEIIHNDDNHLDPESDDEEGYNYEESIFVELDLNNNLSPTFEASFEPVGRIKSISDREFKNLILPPILGALEIYLEWSGASIGQLKKAMFAFVVAQIK